MPNVLKLVDFWKVILWTGAFLALIYKAEIIYKDYSKNLYHLKLHGRKNSAQVSDFQCLGDNSYISGSLRSTHFTSFHS